MAEAGCAIDKEETSGDSNYKAPAKRSVEEILATDAEDESLRRYKASLLGAISTNIVIGMCIFIRFNLSPIFRGE